MVKNSIILLLLLFASNFTYSQLSETSIVKDTAYIESSKSDLEYEEDIYTEKDLFFLNELIDRKSKLKSYYSKNIPGIGYSFFKPNDSLGYYQGVSLSLIEYNVFGAFKYKMPSYIQTAYTLELMLPLKENIEPLIFLGYSIRASFEGKLERNFIVPYFEFNINIGYESNISSFWGVTPTVGIWLKTGENYNINTFYGYYMPFINTDVLAGHKFGLNINYLFW